MTDRGVRTPARGPALVGVVAVATLAAVTRASRPVLSGPDPFWHWDLGRRIVSSGLPRTDPYSFLTGSEHWILNQWGTETILGLVDLIGGLWAVALFAAVLVGGVYLHVGWHMWRRAPSLVSVALLGLVYTAGLSNLTVRGNLFTFLLLPVVLAETMRPSGPRARVILPLMVLWTNLHAGFLLGIVVLGIHTVGELVIARPGTRVTLGRRRGALFVGAVAACLVTPYGPGLLWQVLQLSARGTASGITEWASPALLDSTVLPFTALLAIVLTAIAVSARAHDLPEILLVVALSLLGVSAVRNVAPATIGLGILGAPYLMAAVRQLRGISEAPATAAGVRRLDLVLAASIGLVGLAAVLLIVPRAGSVRAHADNMPLATIEAFAAENRRARVFTTALWTPAVSILAGEETKTSVDGRLELFNLDDMGQWRTIDAVLPGWDDQLDEWCITDVIVPSDSDLEAALTASGEWRHEGTHAVVGSDTEATWQSRSQTGCDPGTA